jgi:hypothetical protein
MAISGIRTRDPSHQEAGDVRLRLHGHRDHPEGHYVEDLQALFHILSLLNPITIDHSFVKAAVKIFFIVLPKSYNLHSSSKIL